MINLKDFGIVQRPIWLRVFMAPGRAIEFWETYKGLPFGLRLRMTKDTTWLSIVSNVGNVTCDRIKD